MRTFAIILSAILLPGFVHPVNSAEPLFADPVVAKGKGVEIRESQVEENFVAFKAARSAVRQPLPPLNDAEIKKQVLDKLIATKVLLGRATPADRDEGKRIAAKVIEEGKAKAGSEQSYRRQLIAVGTTPEKYEADILEQAIVKAVIDRELKNKQIVTDAEVRKYYDEHPSLFEDPEKVRVAHILFATRRIPSGAPLPRAQQEEKKKLAAQAAERARAGEDFSKLVMELSDDTESKASKGELTFSKGGPVPPEFEAAAFSMEPGKISDPVRSVFGFHVIKLIEKIPPSRTPIEKVENRIRDILQERGVQTQLSKFIEGLKKEAGIQVTWNEEER